MRLIGMTPLLLLIASLIGVATPSAVHASLLGTKVTVALLDPASVDRDDEVTVDGSHELVTGDGSDIGDNFLTPLEFIDIQSETLVYHAQGVGGDHPTDSNYQLLGGLGPNASLVFAELDWGAMIGEVVGVHVILDDAIGVTDADIIFNGHQVKIPLDNLGLLKGTGPGGEAVGTISVKLTVSHTAAPVPEASSVAIWLLGGVAGLIACRRRTAKSAG